LNFCDGVCVYGQIECVVCFLKQLFAVGYIDDLDVAKQAEGGHKWHFAIKEMLFCVVGSDGFLL